MIDKVSPDFQQLKNCWCSDIARPELLIMHVPELQKDSQYQYQSVYRIRKYGSKPIIWQLGTIVNDG